VRHLATFLLGLVAGALLAILLTHPATSRQASAPRSAVVMPLAPVGTPAADRGAKSTGERSAPSGPAAPLADDHRTSAPSDLPSPSTSTRAARTEAPATAKPSPATPRATTRPPERLSGVATWYAYRTGQAAAGPRLRAALGRNWRGRTVLVNGVPVRLTDWMGTRDRAKVIDLDDGLFIRVCGPLSMGVCEVSVTW
jgi:hypothetical protein